MDRTADLRGAFVAWPSTSQARDKEASSPERPPERVTDERYTLRLGSRALGCGERPIPCYPSPVDYAGAWTGTKGHCHRLVYTSDDDDCPAYCPQPVITFGWRRDWQGRRHLVDACTLHAGELVSRPGPLPPSARGARPPRRAASARSVSSAVTHL